MTRKQFVEDAVAQLAANPRKVLVGHGISGAMLTKIMKRPDVMKYLCNELYYLKTAKKGAVGLKKTNVFQIKAYKNFAELNTKARLDVEKFMAGLKGKDAEDFNNKDNITTIVFDTAVKLVPGPEGDDVVDQLMNASDFLKFDTAVRKEYKIPGVSYVVIMVAPSAIRPAEEKLAARKEKINKRKNSREEKAVKTRNRLKRRARAALARNKKQLKELKGRQQALLNDKFGVDMINAQYDYLTKKTGADNLWDGIESMNKASAAAIAKKLDTADGKLLMTAYRLMEQGDEESAKLIMSKIKNRRKLESLMKTLNAGVEKYGAGNEMLDTRRRELARTVRTISKKLEQLEVDLALAPAQKKMSIKSMISKYKKQLREIQARMKFYSKNNNTAMSGNMQFSKAQQLAKVRAAIEANIEKGNSISASLNNALAQLEVTPAQQQVIKQQIVQQVADGTPMQFAVQQAIQDNLTTDAIQDVVEDDSLDSGTVTFEELFDML